MAENTSSNKAEARKSTGDRVSETPAKGVADNGPAEDFRTAERLESASGNPVTHPEYEDPILVTPPPAPGHAPVKVVGYEGKDARRDV